MRVNANAVLRSWTLLAAFGSSYAPDVNDGAHSRVKQAGLSGTLSACLSVCASDSRFTKSMSHDF